MEEKINNEASYRWILFDLWVHFANPIQLKEITKELKSRYRTFGEIRGSVMNGDWDWLLLM